MTFNNPVVETETPTASQSKIEFERLLASILTRFINLTTTNINSGINYALEAIGNFIKVDYTLIALLSEDITTIETLYEWHTDTVLSCADQFQGLHLAAIPWLARQLQHQEPVTLSGTLNLPTEAQPEKLLLQKCNIASMVVVPMHYGGNLVGMLAAGSTRAQKIWNEETTLFLSIMEGVIASTLERNKVELALRDSEERFRQFITSISHHIYVTEVTPAGEQINRYISPNVADLTGYPLPEFEKDWRFWPTRVIHPKDQSIAAAQFSRLISGHSSETEYRLIRADGQTIWVRDSGRVEHTGDSLLIYGVVGEVTERKVAEAALAQERALLTQRVQERTAELSLANAELARAARLKDEFLAAMSHELRTPLNAVLGMSEALQEEVYGPINPDQTGALSRIQDSGRHLLSLINDILDLSRIEAGKLDLQLSQVDLDMVCQSSLHFIKKDAQEKNLTVSSIVESGLSLYADEQRLKQMLVNLLSNAVKFTDSGGQIGLEVTRNPDRQTVDLTIWDTGIGIAAENMEQLFKPFVQLDSRLSRHYEGTGLGLTLVYRMAEMHRGSISVESTFGQGSRFTVSLPATVQNPLQNINNNQPKQTVDTMNISQDGTPLILLVEDNEANITTISDYLKAKDFRLVIARDGAEALNRVQEDQPDLVLMDIQMPVMDGMEATRRIRADYNATLPIIALTALAMPGDRERCLAAGANEYISKPVSLRRLVEIIEKFLAESTG